MSKGKFRELLFDINENELTECDEYENPIDQEDEFLLDTEELIQKEIEYDGIEDEFVPIPSPSERRPENYPRRGKKAKKRRNEERAARARELEEAERQKLADGKEKLEDMMAKGAVEMKNNCAAIFRKIKFLKIVNF